MWEPEEGWRQDAACLGAEADLFFPVSEESDETARAKSICEVCPVRDECLQYAFSTKQTEGVWGGMTGSERRRFVRREREKRRRAG
ncbi:MAG: WhiB family transcriptional regulator [Acidimicrobiia bacterium]|jgi:WhiB family redox-sensing transcriptional regulator|nr:WhiB family transcriptional regulator [Acidimicrobiia bacterium]MBT8214934.1 WhiB family transcriptional regulator [Acidimicrobiia bacterium]NNF69623.1 WhiB family transcriptional regulator [Acidimicrobiia bacterium]NNK91691.1 WhiB family transcriptional regulator [Acidimicrobiia bacterium]